MIDARFHIVLGKFSLDVNLAIAEAGVTAVFGPSGSGKTTLLRAIAGLERSDKGFLRVKDRVWQDEKIFLPPHERSVGYVFQEASLFPHMNVRRNVEYGRKRRKRAAQGSSLDAAIELLGIESMLERRPNQLSGGEQQRVAIARALASGPEILLLDEPLASLDEKRKTEILPYLESVHRELVIPVLYVSHSRSEVARLADNVVLLDKGQVTASGPVADIFSSLEFSPAHEADAETVLQATVAEQDSAFGLTACEFSGGRFWIAGMSHAMGRSVRLQVRARDVSIARVRPEQTSILNIFPATIGEIVREGEAQVSVQLKIGSTVVLARITRKSSEELTLKSGDTVFAQIKSVALLT